MLQNNKPFNWLTLIGLLLIIIGLVFLFKTCSRPLTPETPILASVKKDVEKRDSVKRDFRRSDSIRTVIVERWHKAKVKHDTVPCEEHLATVINFCDTVIQADSVALLSAREIIRLDSNIIAGYEKKVEQDSVTIAKLTKKLKWQKRFTKGAFLLGAGLGASARVKLGN